ncbi:MAG: 4-hydroxy-tetrahydrodipicolinate synthase [Bdellovibrionales bacterium]|nr:4-hydroxy-tetrahydrodipicolinate synthase [Bdellovibrionales bacterium]
MIKGIVTALVTPFKDSKVDENSLKNLVQSQLNMGVQGFVVNGTTAESPNLYKEEVEQIFNCVKQAASGKAKIILGTGSNSTAKTIEMTKFAEKLGADGSLVVVPYYNKPTQQGLYQHFKAVAECSTQDIMLYNVPGRTITKLEAETVFKLQEIKNIKGIKEASADLDFDKKLFSNAREDWSYLSGDDATTLDFVGLGGHGAISVLSHVVGDKMIQAIEQAQEQGAEVAKKEFARFNKLTQLLFAEPNPTPVKFALSEMGIIESDELRLPLLPATESLKKEISQELKSLGLIS